MRRAICISAALLCSGCDLKEVGIRELKDAKFAYPPQRFVMLPAASNNAWRLDTTTGDVWLCVPAQTRPVCVQAMIDAPGSK